MVGRALQSRAVQNTNPLPLTQPLPSKLLAHLKPTKKGQKKNVDVDSEPAGPPTAAKQNQKTQVCEILTNSRQQHD